MELYDVGADIHGHRKIAPTDFSDPLSFLLAPPAGQNLSSTLIHDQKPAKLTLPSASSCTV